jgi:uncharacterized protein with PIN domain
VDFSAMTTPIEAHIGAKGLGWIRQAATYVFKFGKRIATLEERVTALEDALKKQPADACPYCGERGMRLSKQSLLMGDPGKQWTQDVWTCEKCGRKETRRKKL